MQVLRFSNENSYLNWARNGVLSSGVGVAMYAQEHHRGAQLSGAGEYSVPRSHNLRLTYHSKRTFRTIATRFWVHWRGDC